MSKKKIHLEFPMNTASGTILWNAISTPSGLQNWLAEEVIANDRIFTFVWSKDEKREAELTHSRINTYVRFHWLDDDDPKSFFELRIDSNELTGEYSLFITDHVDEDEEEDMIDLWSHEVESLQRQLGI